MLQVPLAPGFKAWLREFGVLVPVLDLANHAGGKAATTYFAVDFSSQSTANLKGSKPVFSLVAARDISEGEQVGAVPCSCCCLCIFHAAQVD